MALLGDRFFKSKSNEVEESYKKGVMHLSVNGYSEAERYFRKAAESGHGSAMYNLALIHASGYISPFDVDFAVANYRKAASLGHPTASQYLEQLDSADRGAFGTIALAMFAAKMPVPDALNHLLLMWCCRYYNKIIEMTESADEVIAYELDAASNSEHYYVQSFIKRTGVSPTFFRGGLNNLVKGSYADQITDGLNDLYISMKSAGNSNEICLMTRCTIVGYIIQHSRHKLKAQSLLGVDQFFLGN